MRTISSIRLEHFRIHTQQVFELSPQATVITGNNGAGKTSILEALYIALQGKSFKGTDTTILQEDAPWWRIDVTFNDQSVRTVTFDPARPTGKKQFIIDEKTSLRMMPAAKYPVVLFEPGDLRLLEGSPQRRRDFIDSFVSRLDPNYAMALRRYERALKQRNNLLKQPSPAHDELFVWNMALSEHGAELITKRQKYITLLADRLSESYNQIAQTKDSIMVGYSATYTGDIRQKLLHELTQAAGRDALLGYTSVGPHRHDLTFTFNGSPATTVASRGEVRSIILALKFLEVELLKEATGSEPIVLFDDVFSELDEHRQGALLNQTNQQSIITSVGTPPTLEYTHTTITL